jgi:hypothetical protein
MISWNDGKVPHLPAARAGTAARPRLVRVSVLDTQTDMDNLCPLCGLSLVVVTYAVGITGGLPGGLDRLTYCESCEPV